LDLTPVFRHKGVLLTPSVSEAISADRQLRSFASSMGLKSAEPGTWSAMIRSLLAQVSVAAVLTDMTIPGLPLIYCNEAFTSLTGYAHSDVVGRNCRFLQGPSTEGEVVYAIAKAIRTGSRALVRVTNYNAKGRPFRNLLALHPVRDSNGEHRYTIGLLCDALQTTACGNLKRAFGLLPTRFEAGLAPKVFASLQRIPAEAQRKQWAEALLVASRVAWVADWDAALSNVLSSEEALHAFGSHLHQQSPHEAFQLEVCYRVHQALASPDGQSCIELQQAVLGGGPSHPLLARAALESHARELRAALAAEALRRFSSTQACAELLRRMTSAAARRIKRADDLIWADYSIPADMAGWLHAMCPVLVAFPLPMVLVDVSLPGAPVVLANKSFCKLTGYDLREICGRSMRFLQGAVSEPEAVAAIRDSIRRGIDSHVRITNYRKSGVCFSNLLSLRPVHDSNGVYRFSVGVLVPTAVEVGGESCHGTLDSRLDLLEELMDVLPKTVQVSSRPVGLRHARDGPRQAEVAADKGVSRDRIQAALEEALALPFGPLGGKTDYDNHHIDHVRSCAQANGFALDPQIKAMAGKLGLEPPRPAPWLAMFVHLADLLDVAVLVSEAHGGLPLVYCNNAAARLTRYSVSEMLGRSCRFLQGPDTEDEAVGRLSASLRAAESASVELTNYRKDGSQFRNALFLQPVHDSCGACRYVIGLQADAADSPSVRRAATVFRLLPTRFAAELQPAPLTALVPEAQLHTQWRSSLAALSRLALCADWGATLRSIVRQPVALEAFHSWLRHSPVAAKQLEVCAAAAQLEDLPPDAQTAAVGEMCERHLGLRGGSAEQALAAVTAAAAHAVSVLLRSEALPKFVLSPAFLPLATLLIAEAEELTAGDMPLEAHPRTAREEAALKLRSNHSRVLRDVCNDGRANIDGKPLTQLELLRINPEDESESDAALKEISRRLLGEGTCDPSSRKERAVWAAVARYLSARTQSTAEEKPGREPDMSAPAAAAMRAVLRSMVTANDLAEARELLWPGYHAPGDAEGWVCAFAQAASRLPFSLVLTDTSLAGNPIVFANSAFRELTGYERHEVEGQNCRMLQGPGTERLSLAVMVDALRRGVDCHLRVTNYRKSGERFSNLLSLRPVRDGSSAYRYCVGLLSEIDAQSLQNPDVPATSAKLAALADLFALLPNRFGSDPLLPSSKTHVAAEMVWERQIPLRDRLADAMRGGRLAIMGLLGRGGLNDGVSPLYATSHRSHLEQCARPTDKDAARTDDDRSDGATTRAVSESSGSGQGSARSSPSASPRMARLRLPGRRPSRKLALPPACGSSTSSTASPAALVPKPPSSPRSPSSPAPASPQALATPPTSPASCGPDAPFALVPNFTVTSRAPGRQHFLF